MTINFKIRYTAGYGEEVRLNVIVDDGSHEQTASISMTTLDGELWTCRIGDIEPKSNPHIDYFFTIDSAGRELKREWTGITHRIDLNLTHCKVLSVENILYDIPNESRLYTAAYADCLCRRPATPIQRNAPNKNLRLIVRAPQLLSGQRLAILGSGRALGEWQTDKAIMMNEHNACEWQVDLNATALGTAMEFMFVAIDNNGNIDMETGSRRSMCIPQILPYEAVAMELPQANFNPDKRQLTITHVSMSQLHDEGRFGMGDFGSLAAFVNDIAHSERANIISVPPVNDTISTHTAADATFFSTISVFALHPILADLRQLPDIDDPQENKRMENIRTQLNACDDIDYCATLDAKLEYLRLVFMQEGDKTMHSAAYRRFFAENERWLVPYAQYSYLRDAYSIADFHKWPSHNEWTEAERGLLQNPRTKAYKKLAFIYYVQFVLHNQLKAVHQLAREHSIVLMSDLTANINPNSCDNWQTAHSVGSDEWWLMRINTQCQYFDACRINNKLKRRTAITSRIRMLLADDDDCQILKVY